MVNLEPEDLLNRAKVLAKTIQRILQLQKKRRAYVTAINEDIKRLQETAADLATVVGTGKESQSAQLPMFTPELPSDEDLLRRGEEKARKAPGKNGLAAVPAPSGRDADSTPTPG